ncbi:hypothetical protein [Streptomyces sp. NPDC058108]|uniref:hypothetical protein n=1 Tax=Streptomyces sp. NPDC058108 TaxID=3346344 RepID=UPI0036ECDF1B
MTASRSGVRRSSLNVGFRVMREALPDPSPLTPPAAKVPDHPAFWQIMAVFTTVGGTRLRAGLLDMDDLRSTARTSGP